MAQKEKERKTSVGLRGAWMIWERIWIWWLSQGERDESKAESAFIHHSANKERMPATSNIVFDGGIQQNIAHIQPLIWKNLQSSGSGIKQVNKQI